MRKILIKLLGLDVPFTQIKIELSELHRRLDFIQEQFKKNNMKRNIIKTENYEKDFVPKKSALALKELGFDESCLMAYLGKEKEPYLKCDDTWHLQAKDVLNPTKTPTYSQVFRWFREKHGLHHTIMPEFYKDGINFNWQILWYLPKDKWTEHVISEGTMWLISEGTMWYGDNGEYPSQEEAESACLIKLIEIVKSKKL